MKHPLLSGALKEMSILLIMHYGIVFFLSMDIDPSLTLDEGKEDSIRPIALFLV